MATEKRLTEKHYNGKGYYMKCSGLCHFDGHCANCDELVKIVDRLGEYEDNAKQAVEVVHGHWCWEGKFKACSRCGSYVEWDETLGASFWKFCPYCGAKMDGGADNGL